MLKHFSVFQTGFGAWSFWTAGTRLGSADGTFYWMDQGIRLKYADWIRGSPKNNNNTKSSSDCIYIYNLALYKFDNIPCNDKEHVICESIGDTSEPTKNPDESFPTPPLPTQPPK